MDANTLANLTQIASIVESAGILLFLSASIWAFYTGKIIPRPVVDLILDETVTRLVNEVQQTIRDEVKAAHDSD